jgi:hypothetical protein
MNFWQLPEKAEVSFTALVMQTGGDLVKSKPHPFLPFLRPKP